MAPLAEKAHAGEGIYLGPGPEGPRAGAAPPLNGRVNACPAHRLPDRTKAALCIKRTKHPTSQALHRKAQALAKLKG